MYESHITVEMNREKFVSLCQKINVKPVIIEDDNGSSMPIQMMSAKFHKVDTQEEAIEEMNEIATIFGECVIRRKLELILGQRKPPEQYLYLEFHSKYLLSVSTIEQFQYLVVKCGGTYSKNTLKVPEEKDKVFMFANARSGDVFSKLTGELQQLAKLVNTIRECVIYDDNPHIDSFYGNCGSCAIKEFKL